MARYMAKCYLCNKGELEKKKADFSLYGKLIGKFDAEVCNTCHETFFDEGSSEKIDEAIIET